MAVAFDAASVAQNGTTSPFTWSHTATGSNLIVFVALATGTDAATLAVTYGGTSMTSISKIHSNNSNVGFVQLFGLKAPASGASTVSVSGNAGNNTGGFSISFNGADQTTGWQNTATAFGSSTTPATTVTSATGNMVLSTVCNGSSITSANQTSRGINNHDGASGAGNNGISTAAGAASVAMGWVALSDFWAIIGVDVIAAGAGGGATNHYLGILGAGN